MDGEVMFMRLLAVNCRKKVPLHRVLSFENSPVPLSLFAEDGVMVSCTKSDFMHKLEDLVPGTNVNQIEGCDAVIFDGPLLASSSRLRSTRWLQISGRTLSPK